MRRPKAQRTKPYCSIISFYVSKLNYYLCIVGTNEKVEFSQIFDNTTSIIENLNQTKSKLEEVTHVNLEIVTEIVRAKNESLEVLNKLQMLNLNLTSPDQDLAEILIRKLDKGQDLVGVMIDLITDSHNNKTTSTTETNVLDTHFKNALMLEKISKYALFINHQQKHERNYYT